jgi:hypothetical protein
MIMGLPVLAGIAIYLFLTIRSLWERLWVGPVAAALLVSAVEAFEPRLVSPMIGVLRFVSLALWLSSLVVGAVLVASAFRTGGPYTRLAHGRPARPAGLRGWTLVAFMAYPIGLALAVGLNGIASAPRALRVLLPIVVLIYSLFLLSVSIRWARTAYHQPTVGALRLALGALLCSSLLALIVTFSCVPFGIVSSRVVLRYAALWTPLAAVLASVIVYLAARRRLELRTRE